MGDVTGCQGDVNGMGLVDTELFPGGVTQSGNRIVYMT
jgi:hypothetical protein